MKKKVCFIRAKLKKDYVFDGIKASGFDIIIPYKDTDLLKRVLREAWSRLRLPGKSMWYNKAAASIDADVIVVKDPLITAEYMEWLRRQHPDKTIVFDYDNRVSRSMDPGRIRPYVDEIWSYDEDDCRDYGLRNKGSSYYEVYKVRTAAEPDIDVLYVGRDKGRLGQLLSLEARMKEMGLRTHFHICADRSFLTWKNKIYKKFLPYEEYLELLKRSRAILNIVADGQTSITQREMEAVFDNVKCITNNKGIPGFDLYSPDRFFVLGSDDMNELKPFIMRKSDAVSESALQKYCFRQVVEHMTE